MKTDAKKTSPFTQVLLRRFARGLRTAVTDVTWTGKRRLQPLVVICNTKIKAALEELAVANDALPTSLFQLADGGALRVPFGDFPQRVILTGANAAEARAAGVRLFADGSAIIMQRVDAAAGNEMAAELASLRGKVRRFFLGAPIYNGHPFHPDPTQRPSYPDKRAYGWIKAVNVEADGILLEGVYNSLGEETITDGQLVFHSPEWNMRLIAVENGVGIYRPVRLRSTGLTNEPNIPVPPLVGANTDDGSALDVVTDDFISAAREALDDAERSDFAPLVAAVNEVLSAPDDEFMDRLAALRERLPEIAKELAGSQETVTAWERILGAAAANGISEVSSDQVSSVQVEENEPEPKKTMLQKLIELLAAAGIIQADDPEDTVLTKLGDMKDEMNWKREELMRQKMEADRIRSMLPAANVAALSDAGEDVPLLSSELVTAATEVISALRVERDAAVGSANEFREALANVSVQVLIEDQSITGAQVDEVREKLLSAANQVAMHEVMQSFCKSSATTTVARLSEGLAGGREKVVAANAGDGRLRERAELVTKHLDALGVRNNPTQAQYQSAWAAAQRERPELF